VYQKTHEFAGPTFSISANVSGGFWLSFPATALSHAAATGVPRP
jgi:hypothetical protein